MHVRQRLNQAIYRHNAWKFRQNKEKREINYSDSTRFEIICKAVKVKVKFSIARRTRGKFSTTERDINYQLLAIMLLKLPNGLLPVCSQPQPAAGNGVREGRSNFYVLPVLFSTCSMYYLFYVLLVACFTCSMFYLFYILPVPCYTSRSLPFLQLRLTIYSFIPEPFLFKH